MQVPKKILVVDDDPAARAYVEEVLSDVGFVCVAVASGRDALARIDVDRDIAVVVSDLVMPGLDGVRLGAVDYLIKPVAPDELVVSVSRALAASRAIMGSTPGKSVTLTYFRNR